MLREHKVPNLILMDIECFEGRVLSVSTTMIRESRPIFVIETHHREVQEGIENANLIRASFKDAEYTFYDINFRKVTEDEMKVGNVLPHHVLVIPNEKRTLL